MNTGLQWLSACLLVVATAVTAQAQRGDRGLSQVDRATQAATRAQESAARAQERASQAQERSAASQDRTGRAADAAGRAGDATAVGLDIAASARSGPSTAAGFRQRHRAIVLANPQALELVDRFAAVRGEIVSIDPSAEALLAAQRAGFTIVADETIEGIELRFVTLHVPSRRTVRRALADLRRLAPETEFAANHIHVQSGVAQATSSGGRLAPNSPIAGPAIGLIDGGIGETALLRSIRQQGFAAGAPAPDPHATALASLLAGTHDVKSSAPGAPLLVADVYGHDPKGGNSVSLARALGWMAQQRVSVLVIGLVGPGNPIVARAISQAQARGMIVVAPVGNAGAAAPPMYPAAYPGVIGVTGVDGRNRALVEAGRGAHVDFAAPGADVLAAAPGSNLIRVRGTSYAAPLVAGRLWLARRSGDPVAALAAEAADLGRPGRDDVFGHGLVCGDCR
jgi:minor extracellular protease Epr